MLLISLCLSGYIANRVFVVWYSLLCAKGILRKNIGFLHFIAQRSSFKVPTPATPNAVDRKRKREKESVSGFLNGLQCHVRKRQILLQLSFMSLLSQ